LPEAGLQAHVRGRVQHSEEAAAMDTRLMRVADVPMSSGLAKNIAIPIKPERFVGFHEGRLGKLVGMTQSGVNLVSLDPGAMSSLRHWHQAEDEFVYVLSGELTLVDENGAHTLTEGSFVGFPAGAPNAHHVMNVSAAPGSFLAIGSRRPGEETITYPDDDFGPVRK
jgi:uncharacterized cupin superfamily protein